jgi:hypothetical protein
VSGLDSYGHDRWPTQPSAATRHVSGGHLQTDEVDEVDEASGTLRASPPAGQARAERETIASMRAARRGEGEEGLRLRVPDSAGGAQEGGRSATAERAQTLYY